MPRLLQWCRHFPPFPTLKPCGVCPPPEKVLTRKKNGEPNQRGKTTFVGKTPEGKIKLKVQCVLNRKPQQPSTIDAG